MKIYSKILLIIFIIGTGKAKAQTVTSVPLDTGNDRFVTEYFSVIRPGLSLNGFDNTGSTSHGLGLKQVLNAALSGDVYIKSKLNRIFNEADDNFTVSNPNNDQIEIYSRILQYTAFEALASYVLEENGIDSTTSTVTSK